MVSSRPRLLNAKFNQFIFAVKSAKIANFVKFLEAVCEILCS